MSLKYAGIKVKGDQVVHRQGSGPVAGTTARVESAGEIDRRLSATRVILTGPLGLFWKKKKDSRQVFLTVEGPGYSIVEEVGPKEQKAARQFAAKLTAMGSRPAAASPPQPSAPPPPAAPPPAAIPAEASLMDKLRELGELHGSGILDAAEFAAAKAQLLGTSGTPSLPLDALAPPPPPPSFDHLPPPPG